MHDWSYKISNVHQLIQEIAHKISSFLYSFPFNVAMCTETGSHVSYVHTNDNQSTLSQLRNTCHLFPNDNQYSLTNSLTITQPWWTPLFTSDTTSVAKLKSGRSKKYSRTILLWQQTRNKGCWKRPWCQCYQKVIHLTLGHKLISCHIEVLSNNPAECERGTIIRYIDAADTDNVGKPGFGSFQS